MGRIVWEQIVCERELLWGEFFFFSIYPDSTYMRAQYTHHPLSAFCPNSAPQAQSVLLKETRKKEICDYFDPRDKSGDD